MTKKRFAIMIQDRSFIKVDGYVSGFFGLHRSATDPRWYNVTHLLTGLRIVGFEYQKQAKAFIEKANETDWHVSWDTSDKKKLKQNGALVTQLESLILKG